MEGKEKREGGDKEGEFGKGEIALQVSYEAFSIASHYLEIQS